MFFHDAPQNQSFYEVLCHAIKTWVLGAQKQIVFCKWKQLLCIVYIAFMVILFFKLIFLSFSIKTLKTDFKNNSEFFNFFLNLVPSMN